MGVGPQFPDKFQTGKESCVKEGQMNWVCITCNKESLIFTFGQSQIFWLTAQVYLFDFVDMHIHTCEQ